VPTVAVDDIAVQLRDFTQIFLLHYQSSFTSVAAITLDTHRRLSASSCSSLCLIWESLKWCAHYVIFTFLDIKWVMQEKVLEHPEKKLCGDLGRLKV